MSGSGDRKTETEKSRQKEGNSFWSLEPS
jgi:hypothetical protein